MDVLRSYAQGLDASKICAAAQSSYDKLDLRTQADDSPDKASFTRQRVIHPTRVMHPTKEETDMASRSLWVLTSVFAVALGACAANRDRSSPDAMASISQGSAELMTSRVRNWSAPNDDTLMIEAVDGRHYQARLFGPCPGLTFANRLAYVTRGMNQLDRFATVVLPDGTRCPFQSFTRISSPVDSAREGDSKH
jgi:hypothetical protein